MGFVHPERADVFVSYARVDDKPATGVEVGWVTTLVRSLESSLARKLGRADYSSLWTDNQLAAGARLTPDLEAGVRSSATILMLLSPGYLASHWCMAEMAAFLDEDARRPKGKHRRVYAIECDRLEPPALLKDILRTRFWEEDPDSKRPRLLGFPVPDPKADKRYYNKVDDLAVDIASELQLQKSEFPAPGVPAAGIAPANPAPSKPASGLSIFLSETTDDLEDQRDEVKRFLIQAGHRILPERQLPQDLMEFEERVQADLSGSILFVQLLSEVSGRKFADTEKRFPAVQRDLAAGMSRSILQWRSPVVDLARVAAGPHRELLDGPEVMKVGLEEFKAAILTRVKKLTAPPPPPVVKGDANCFIFVNASDDDLPLAKTIKAELDRRNVGNALPLRSGKVSQDRADFEQNLRECDGLLVVFGQSEPHWVRSQLLQSRKILSQRESPLTAIGVYEGPPTKADDALGGFSLPNLKVLRGDSGAGAEVIGHFIETVLTRSTP